MKKTTIPSLLLTLLIFTANPVLRADDIATIRAYLDNKTGVPPAQQLVPPAQQLVPPVQQPGADVLHEVYLACLNLTRTGTSDAVPILKQLLDDERFNIVALTALTNIPGGLEREIPAQPELTPEAALLASILQDAEPGLPRFVAALKDEKTPFKVLQRAVLELKSDQTGIVVLQNMGNLPVEKQAALILNLGARKDSAAIVPRLIAIAQGDQPLLQCAAIQALGEIGDVRAVDAILLALGSPDAEISKAAQTSLKQFQGLEFEKKMIALLDGNDTKLQLAALEIVGERQMEDAQPQIWGLLLPRKKDDAAVRIAAFKAYGKAVDPIVPYISALTFRAHDTEAFDGTEEEKTAQINAFREAMTTLCRRTTQRDAVAELFIDLLTRQDLSPAPTTDQRSFYLDCLFQLGGEKAAACLASVAMQGNDALTDKATQLLGRWTTPEVAPYLIEIAEKHPNERYRVRTFSGYLRVIRQMGLPVEQKVQMAEKALAVAPRDADKQAATEVLNRFRAMMKGTPIFDGQTFDGWEFRNNEQWFRIEDGAIVGGSLEESIPHNEFLTSVKEYGDFTLRIECKAIGQGCNGGVQFRSFRRPADGDMPNEMIGYQADMTDDAAYWGAIYDEFRRNRFIAEPDRALIDSIFRPNDWNEYEIVCRGNNIKLYLNGTLTVDYTETDADIPARGFIGLQIHSGPPSETWYRNIRMEE